MYEISGMLLCFIIIYFLEVRMIETHQGYIKLFNVCDIRYFMVLYFYIFPEVRITKDTLLSDDKVIDSDAQTSTSTRRKCSDDTNSTWSNQANVWNLCLLSSLICTFIILDYSWCYMAAIPWKGIHIVWSFPVHSKLNKKYFVLMKHKTTKIVCKILAYCV